MRGRAARLSLRRYKILRRLRIRDLDSIEPDEAVRGDADNCPLAFALGIQVVDGSAVANELAGPLGEVDAAWSAIQCEANAFIQAFDGGKIKPDELREAVAEAIALRSPAE